MQGVDHYRGWKIIGLSIDRELKMCILWLSGGMSSAAHQKLEQTAKEHGRIIWAVDTLQPEHFPILEMSNLRNLCCLTFISKRTLQKRYLCNAIFCYLRILRFWGFHNTLLYCIYYDEAQLLQTLLYQESDYNFAETLIQLLQYHILINLFFNFHHIKLLGQRMKPHCHRFSFQLQASSLRENQIQRFLLFLYAPQRFHK